MLEYILIIKYLPMSTTVVHQMALALHITVYEIVRFHDIFQALNNHSPFPALPLNRFTSIRGVGGECDYKETTFFRRYDRLSRQRIRCQTDLILQLDIIHFPKILLQ